MALRFDSPVTELGCTTQAPKALRDAGIDTIGQLIGLTEAAAAEIKGLGDYRLADVKTAMAAHRLRFTDPLANQRRCTSCPQCPECGNPRTDDPRQVVVSVTGRHKHHGNELLPTCDSCDAHHRALFAGATA